jgi:hypothetical protein
MKMTRDDNQTKGQTMHNPNDFFVGDQVLIDYRTPKLSVSGIIDGIKIGESKPNSVELRFEGHYYWFDLEAAEVEKI